MKKVFLMAYARKNLGDDIFIKMILERYPHIDFYIKVPNYDYMKELDEKYENIHILIGKDTDIELYNSNVEDYDGYIYAGGSIFMEGGKVYNLSEEFYDFVKRCKEKNIPFCYVSSNYGPYQTQEYFDLSIKNFKVCTDICFRDLYSYNLFKDIESVRYAPDFVFDLNFKNNEKIKDSIGISVILREDDFNKVYYNFLKNNIKNYINNGKTIYLYSFCEHEGDIILIDKLMEEFKDTNKVIAIKYDGHIDSFLENFSSMEYMITARFHAMILSLLANQKIYIVSYSEKIDNVIKDLDLGIPILKTENIKEDILLDLNDFAYNDKEKIEKIKEQAKNQEQALIKYFKS